MLNILLLHLICSNKWLLIVDGEIFLSLSCHYPSNMFQRITPSLRRSSKWIVSLLIRESFKNNVHTEGIDKQTKWKRTWWSQSLSHNEKQVPTIVSDLAPLPE